MTDSSTEKPCLGFGLGLRPDHYEQVLNDRPAIDWLEVISENYMIDGGKPLHYLDRIRELYPMVMHGVSMSIGSTAPLNLDYLANLKQSLLHKAFTGELTANPEAADSILSEANA